MKRWIAVIALGVFVSSCGAAPEAAVVPTAMSAPTVTPTNIPKPTVEPTPVPLDKIDLVAILTDTSALPKGLTAGKVDGKAPDYKSAVTRPASINAAVLTVLHGKDPAGTVVIWIYDDGTKTNDSYSAQKSLISLIAQQSGDPVEAPPDIGKQAVVITMTSGTPGTFLEFVRCRAVVDIGLTSDVVDSKNVAVYAKDLDTRLMPLVCQ